MGDLQHWGLDFGFVFSQFWAPRHRQAQQGCRTQAGVPQMHVYIGVNTKPPLELLVPPCPCWGCCGPQTQSLAGHGCHRGPGSNPHPAVVTIWPGPQFLNEGANAGSGPYPVGGQKHAGPCLSPWGLAGQACVLAQGDASEGGDGPYVPAIPMNSCILLCSPASSAGLESLFNA